MILFFKQKEKLKIDSILNNISLKQKLILLINHLKSQEIDLDYIIIGIYFKSSIGIICPKMSKASEKFRHFNKLMFFINY
jgi:hypothetical protein